MSVYKITVVGSGGAGKSSLIIRYTQNIFVDEYNPTIEDVHKKRLYNGVNNDPILLDIIDTAGQEEFSSISEYYLKDSDGVVIVYSVISVNSFETTEKYFKDIARLKNGADIPIILVGNKIDLKEQRSVSTQQGEECADIHNCLFIEASAMSNKRVFDIFEILVKEMIKRRTLIPKSRSRSGITKNECVIV